MSMLGRLCRRRDDVGMERGRQAGGDAAGQDEPWSLAREAARAAHLLIAEGLPRTRGSADRETLKQAPKTKRKAEPCV
jgi:hypothetical protein